MLQTIKRHGKTVMFLVLAATMILALGTSSLAKQLQTQPTSYRTITEIFDWGAATTKIIVSLGKSVEQGSIDKDTFTVFVSRSDDRKKSAIIDNGYRTVTKAYVSNEVGKPVEIGKYATMELEIGPSVSLGSPLNYYSDFNKWINSDYKIVQVKDISAGSEVISGIITTTFAGGTRELVDEFTTGAATFDNITLTYAAYSPAKDPKKRPLIIWLHGGGEGGTDPTVPLAANKSVNLITKEIQAYFGGAYVLVPQTPTIWMDGFNHLADGSSIYEKALMALIEDYVSKNSDIDRNRIYIGGCSNGGYMTMIMIRDYPGYFAAAFPVCEGLANYLITDKDIQVMKNSSIWFTCAATDHTLPPMGYTLPTYKRLIKAGAKNVQLSLFDKVVDTTGLYKNADGTPYEYNGHWSWIYVYNNQCNLEINGKKTTIMEWMAAQSLNKTRD